MIAEETLKGCGQFLLLLWSLGLFRCLLALAHLENMTEGPCCITEYAVFGDCASGVVATVVEEDDEVNGWVCEGYL